MVDGAALRMEQSAENQATTCSICRDDGRRSLLEVLCSAPARTMETVTIIAITAETPGERARKRQGYTPGAKPYYFDANLSWSLRSRAYGFSRNNK